MELNLRLTNVFQRTLEASQNPNTRIICEEGGSRSSKTWSIYYFFILKAMAGERFTVTIARSKLTWVKETLLQDFDEICKLNNFPVTPEVNINRPEQTYKIKNATFRFAGLDYAEKLHGMKQDYLWLNEVMEIGKKEFDQLEMRTSKLIILDYNPYDDTHWVFDLQKRSDVVLIHSTMLDNPFNPEPIMRKIKGYEPTPENIKQGTADLYMWEVYGLGKKARLQGAIFTNWDILELPKDDDGNMIAKFLGHGLDFGYTNDPTALIGLYIANNEVWLDEEIYQTGLMNISSNPDDDTIVKHMRLIEIPYNDDICADSSEPKSIEEIRREGFHVYGADKGQDSVNFGIDLMKGYKIHITPRSTHLEGEFRKYKWAEDKDGKSLNKPIDEFNHGIDASRYIITNKLRRNATPTLHNINDLGL